MSVLIGISAALLVWVAIAVGAYLGWWLKAYVDKRTAPAPVEADEPSQKARDQLVQDQQAFKTLMGYNIDMAYGEDQVSESEAEVSVGLK